MPLCFHMVINVLNRYKLFFNQPREPSTKQRKFYINYQSCSISILRRIFYEDN